MAKVKSSTAVKPMKKQKLFEYFAQKQDITKKQARGFFEMLRDLIHSELKACGTFTLPDLGKFNMKLRKARIGRNPATGASIKIPEKMTLKFRVAKAAKDSCLPPVAAKKKK